MEQQFIRINQLNKYYNRRTRQEVHVINNTTLTLPEKGLVCILGESGSGKTTLMHAVGALDTFASGEVTIGKQKLTGRMNREAEKLRNEEYGFVFQNYYLLNEETVEENMRLALCLYELSEEETDARISYVLESVEMLRYRKRKVSELSGGQRQRVAIARALLRSPRVIFADEPVGNLDESNTMMVMGILKKVSRNNLVLLTTHEKRLAQFFADRIIRVSDGKIVEGYVNTQSDGYQRSDDLNLYLGEFEMQTVHTEHMDARLYGAFEEPLTLKVVNCDGKYYFALPKGVKAEILTEQSEVKLVEGKRLALEQREVENTAFHLEKITPKRAGTLSFRQMCSMIAAAFSGNRRRLVFPMLCMAITAVLTVLAVSDMILMQERKVQEFAKSHSQMLHVSIEKNRWNNDGDYKAEVAKAYDALLDGSAGWVVYPEFQIGATVKNQSFEQLGVMSARLSRYSYVPVSMLKESNLICGRMPELPNEIVADKALLEFFMAQDKAVSKAYTHVNQFLNTKIRLDKKEYSPVIVGVSDTNEMAIYMDDTAGIGYAVAGTAVASLASLQKAYPGVYDEVVLTDTTILVSESRYEIEMGHEYFEGTFQQRYQIAGQFPVEFPADCVIADEHYTALLRSQNVENGQFLIYTQDKESVFEKVKQLENAGTLEAVRIIVTDDYGTGAAEYDAARQEILGIKMVMTAMVLVLSLLMLTISMKAMAMQNVENISVYRLMGIRGSSIVKLYAGLIAALTACSTLPGMVLCAGVMYLLSGVRALGLEYELQIPVLLVMAAGLLLANVFAGLLPIYSIVKTPPAQLAAKADM